MKVYIGDRFSRWDYFKVSESVIFGVRASDIARKTTAKMWSVYLEITSKDVFLKISECNTIETGHPDIARKTTAKCGLFT